MSDEKYSAQELAEGLTLSAPFHDANHNSDAEIMLAARDMLLSQAERIAELEREYATLHSEWRALKRVD